MFKLFHFAQLELEIIDLWFKNQAFWDEIMVY